VVHALFDILLVSYDDFAYAQIFHESESGHLAGIDRSSYCLSSRLQSDFFGARGKAFQPVWLKSPVKDKPTCFFVAGLPESH